ncbi:MAG: tRNA (adenosine(37)-N6)-dimethylallyltransferase MiaA [Candidatus Binatia bacterium]
MRWIVIAGPTASGKSALGVEVAERFAGEIVNADSRQIYRYMDIGTAKPSAAERARVPHHLFDVATPAERFDAARYRDLARAALRDVAARGRLPIVVGGTGLYLRALARGLFPGPRAEPALRRALGGLEARAPGSLHRWCARLDPAAAARVHSHDAVRLVRALEVVLRTGVPMSLYQRRHGFADTVGEALILVVDPGVVELKARIRERTELLFARGLVEEVRGLWAKGFGPELAVMHSIGYREAGQVLRGECSIDDAKARVVRATERLAKRQRTWFRAERGAVWLHPANDRSRLFAAVERFAAEL